ncbi:sugar phosphate isomerase/epimerase family protein [Paenibacillus sp. MMS20-IR301]|uniref:sugar phosphate isomerase/epimerase family protein n=1 Tax=Paenibacillus sp. MMS20-IR301 TaxID=2895946 RepID=UPI0028EC04A4|nr:sugar phosphate isomerase/epimerase family protein [Paenibacillus sp. MMS20-IR301]WNS42367.1 sugar phosphate isomerase/epimerase family protein [Paenibacillus sp. MMS20-IR301]
MKLSVFYNHIVKASEQSGLPLEAVLDKVHACGIEAVELDLQEALAGAEALKQRLDSAGIAVASMYAFCDFGNDPAPEPGYRFIDTAAYFGAGKVLVIPGFLAEAASLEDRNQALKGMASALTAVCGYAEHKGIRVTMEDFDDIRAPFSSAGELLWFLEQVPKLSITFDTGNFIYRGEDELEAFAKLKHRIIHVHCKDRLLEDSGGELKLSTAGIPLYPSPVGAGCIRIAEILHLLKAEGYDDTLAIEHFDATDQLAYMEQSAAWLRARLE